MLIRQVVGFGENDVCYARDEVMGSGGPGPGSIDDKVKLLIKDLKNPDAFVRSEAVLALGKIGEKAVPALIEALKDTDKYVRLHATRALGKIGQGASPEVLKLIIPALTEALKDTDKYVRLHATRALERIERITSGSSQ